MRMLKRNELCAKKAKNAIHFYHGRKRMCLFYILSFFFSFSFSGSLSFMFISGNIGEHGIRSNYGILTVLKSPDPPKILQGDYMVTTEDREIELECVSENGKPAAEVLTTYHIRIV